ncbi:hypothetical protein BDZ94DRAFT_1244081 [Collybia nuda]|uniref:Cytosine-specific methyltransferase n=1 Tax=Collybia nuda TaxID=64659 RepID=A0A9P5YHZ2_9AGAR|nr:hypothetical protein BDZ94DRAFT_1244081 [Collybia nuda]
MLREQVKRRKGQRIVAVVELPARPPFTASRRPKRPATPDSDPQTESIQPVTSPRKRRKPKNLIDGSQDISNCPPNVSFSGQHLSPTVSDVGFNTKVHSPTVSDFLMDDTSPVSSIIDLTLSCDDEETFGFFPPTTPGSSVRLEGAASPQLRRYRENSEKMNNQQEEGSTDDEATLSAPVKQKWNVLSPTPTSEDVQIYEFMDDELVETADLVIPGETAVDLGSSSIDIEDAPIRLLQDFTIYNIITNEMVPFGELLSLRYSSQKFGASGLVNAWADFDDDGVEDGYGSDTESLSVSVTAKTGERVKLSEILEFSVHDFLEETKALDSKIYLRTSFAWYILDTPSALYQPLFIPFWTQHRILHLLVTHSLKNPRITYEQFLDIVSQSDDEPLNDYPFFKAELSHKDTDTVDVKAYIISSLPDLCAETGIRIARVPLVKSVVGSHDFNFVDTPPPRGSNSKSKKNHHSNASKMSDKEKEVLKHRNLTVVTPIVSRIAKNLFKGSLEVAGVTDFNEKDEDVAAEIDNTQSHHSDPESMQWIDENNGDGYVGVIMDGVTYLVGDDVMVNPGDDEDMIRARNADSDAAQSINSYANRLWFCRICYFFETTENGRNVKMFHGQWFVHGSKTILQETAHSKSLYLTNKCEDNPIASIFKKCNIRMMGPGDEEIPDDGKPDSNDFHCALVWSEENADFLDLPTKTELEDLLPAGEPSTPCFSCALKAREAELEQLRIIPNGFTQYGVDYHLYDFIYILPHDSSGVLEIAQILKIKGKLPILHLTVQRYGRYNDLTSKSNTGESGLVSDERRLFLENDSKYKISSKQIDGICYIQCLTDPEEIEQWVEHNDHFYVNKRQVEGRSLVMMQASELKICTSCHNNRVETLQCQQDLRSKNEPLRALELFSGAGGLGTGMDMSGFVETKYAVEFSPSAAITFKINHPQTTVYCQDSSLLLKHAIESNEGKKPKPLLSNDGSGFCEPMPTKGSIDIVQGGPPCQSFSMANHYKQADDIRSTLPGNMLSYVEHYDPKYFLLENVKGLLDYPLMSNSRKGGRSLEGGIKSGVVKFIMRALEALGYQVRYKLLQAGQYGAPQGRRRVIFWGAKRGLQIPNFPVPVYAFPKGVHRCTLPTGGYMLPMSRSLVPGDYHQCAPLKAITVNDAISDLPAFEWKNPNKIFPCKPTDKAETRARLGDGILQFEAVLERGVNSGLPGFIHGTTYKTKPMNRYQRWIRAGALNDKGGEERVKGHYTKMFGARLVEATVRVPLRPWADHRDLPVELQPDHAKPGAKNASRSFYGRMDGNSHFKCAMTSVAPNIKNSWVLHPMQKRIISVRECARAQGFPDHYMFMSADDAKQKMVDNQMRQIGNAVPVPLSLALGKSLGEALLKEWAKKEREGSPIV